MADPLLRILLWTPRVLGIAFAVFLSLFALDAFQETQTFWQALPAFLIHLIPSAIIVAVLALAWRWEWIGAVLFFAAGMIYLMAAWRHISWVLGISGPLFLLAVLFLVCWIKRQEVHSHSTPQ